MRDDRIGSLNHEDNDFNFDILNGQYLNCVEWK